MCRILSAREGGRNRAYTSSHCHRCGRSHQEAKHGGRETQEDSAMIQVRLNNIKYLFLILLCPYVSPEKYNYCITVEAYHTTTLF